MSLKEENVQWPSPLPCFRKLIPVAKFPSHVSELTADQNRGFSMEYEVRQLLSQSTFKELTITKKTLSRHFLWRAASSFDKFGVKSKSKQAETGRERRSGHQSPGFCGSHLPGKCHLKAPTIAIANTLCLCQQLCSRYGWPNHWFQPRHAFCFCCVSTRVWSNSAALSALTGDPQAGGN